MWGFGFGGWVLQFKFYRLGSGFKIWGLGLGFLHHGVGFRVTLKGLQGLDRLT